MQTILFIMGVSGSGKTTVGKLLSKQTGIPFFDADDFHSTANVEKMKAGVPLTDEDRASWLQSLNQLAKENQTTGAVIACSALKETYRQQLADGLHHVQWVYLKGSYALIHERMLQRPHHYFQQQCCRVNLIFWKNLPTLGCLMFRKNRTGLQNPS